MSISHVTAEGGRRNLHTMVREQSWAGPTGWACRWFARAVLVVDATRPRAGAHIRPCRSVSMPNPVPIRTGLAVDPPGEYEPHSGDSWGSWGGAETADDLLAKTHTQTSSAAYLAMARRPSRQHPAALRCDVRCYTTGNVSCLQARSKDVWLNTSPGWDRYESIDATT